MLLRQPSRMPAPALPPSPGPVGVGEDRGLPLINLPQERGEHCPRRPQLVPTSSPHRRAGRQGSRLDGRLGRPPASVPSPAKQLTPKSPVHPGQTGGTTTCLPHCRSPSGSRRATPRHLGNAAMPHTNCTASCEYSLQWLLLVRGPVVKWLSSLGSSGLPMASYPRGGPQPCPPAHKVLLVSADAVQDELGVGVGDHHTLQRQHTAYTCMQWYVCNKGLRGGLEKWFHA